MSVAIVYTKCTQGRAHATRVPTVPTVHSITIVTHTGKEEKDGVCMAPARRAVPLHLLCTAAAAAQPTGSPSAAPAQTTSPVEYAAVLNQEPWQRASLLLLAPRPAAQRPAAKLAPAGT